MEYFVAVDHEQGTDPWRSWRHAGIGSSDASVIMGESPFKLRRQLLQEKRGPVLKTIPSSKALIGIRLEPHARDRYISHVGENVRPVCLQSVSYPWMRASLDGFSGKADRIVEIKCGQTVYKEVAHSKKVPQYYYGQLQHLMAVTGLSFVDFWCHWPAQPDLLLTVERNQIYIDRLIELESRFWILVENARSTEDEDTETLSQFPQSNHARVRMRRVRPNSSSSSSQFGRFPQSGSFRRRSNFR